MFIAPFVPSPICVVERMLKIADLKAGEILFDMGSGDGRTLLMAAKDFGARGVGIELREDLAKRAMGSVEENNLSNRITIVNGDMFTVNLTSADVVFLYLTTSANERIKPKLERELKKGVRVVSHDYEVIGWRPEKIENFCENPQLGYPSHTLYLYKKP
ncbi:MAG: methyltransferase domain-containing protein [Candidatus Bathyarchaeota archaeon]|nr:methyltransferase domain-containing protein [Candidatus Bathyarchaeota archaeon]